MGIEELEHKIYRRDKEEKVEKAAVRRADEIKPVPPRVGSEWGKTLPSEKFISVPPAGAIAQKFKQIVIVLGILIVVGFGTWSSVSRLLKGSQLNVGVTGPLEVQAGEPVRYEVLIGNQTRGALSNATLLVRADSGIEFMEAPERTLLQRTLASTLAPLSSAKEEVEIVPWGKEGEERVLEVTVRYNQGEAGAIFEKTIQTKIKIAKAALSLDTSLPKRMIVDEVSPLSFGWKSEISRGMPRLRAELTLPTAFELPSVSPAPTSTGTPLVWVFKDLGAGETKTIALSGKTSGGQDEVKTFHFRVGTFVRNVFLPLAEDNFQISVTGNPLAIGVSVNGQQEYHASLSDTLSYTISFKNHFDRPIKDVIIMASFEGAMFDETAVDTVGAYSSAGHSVLWHGGNTPQLLVLNPGEGGTVNMGIRLRPQFPDGMKNATVKLKATISTATKPQSIGAERPLSQTVENITKIKGLVELSAKAYRNDPQRAFSNGGAWPMKANASTDFAVYVTVRALGNDFNDLLLKTFLPNNVTFAGKTQGDLGGTEIVANPRTNEVTWKVPKLDAWSTKSLMFQVRATPTVTDVNRAIPVLNQVDMAGTDDFTGNDYNLHSNLINSNLPDDATINQNDGIVRP